MDCGNCDCANKSQCTKKSNQFALDVVETSYVEAAVMDMPATENDGKCSCGPNCACTTCTCGH